MDEFSDIPEIVMSSSQESFSDEDSDYLEEQKQKRLRKLKANMDMLVEGRRQRRKKFGEESYTDYYGNNQLNNEDNNQGNNEPDDIVEYWNEIRNQKPEELRRSPKTRKLFGRTSEKGGRTRKLRRVKRRKTRKARQAKKPRQTKKTRTIRKMRK